MDDDLPGLHHRRDALTGAAGFGAEVEGELAAGELAGGHRAAYVEGLGRPEGRELFGAVADRGVEVEGVGEVEDTFDVGDAVVGGPVGVDVEAASVGGLAAVLLGALGVEGDAGLVDEALDPGPADLADESGQLAVHEVRAVQGQRRGQLRESPGLPQRDLAGADQLPGALEPVGQLEGVTDQGPGGVGGQAEGGAELHRRELRDQRRPLTRERNGQLPEHQPRGGRLGDRLFRVHRRPHQGRLQDVDLRPLGRSPTALCERQHGGWGVAVGEFGGGHASVYSNARSRRRGWVRSKVKTCSPREARPGGPARRVLSKRKAFAVRWRSVKAGRDSPPRS